MLNGLDRYLRDRIFGEVGININPGRNSETGELYYTIGGIEISIDYNSKQKRFKIARLVSDDPVEHDNYDLNCCNEDNLYHCVWLDFIQPSLQKFQRNKRII